MRQLYCFIFLIIIVTIIIVLTLLSPKSYDILINKIANTAGIDFIGNKTVNTTGLDFIDNQSLDNYSRCLLNMDEALNSLSIPWFLTYGTALMYWRSKNFVSDDMDIGVFYTDFKSKKYTESYFLSHMTRQFNFKLLSTYGSLADGKEWTFSCPKSQIRIDIFFFYEFNDTNSSYNYWSASYNGLCDEMIYKKCRWGFSDFNLTTFEMYGKLFSIVPIGFIIEQYGSNYMTPKKYGYFESLNFLPNLIRKYRRG